MHRARRRRTGRARSLGDGGDQDAGKLLDGQIPLQTAIAMLKPLLEDPAVLKIGQNIKYDIAVFAPARHRGRRRSTTRC